MPPRPLPSGPGPVAPGVYASTSGARVPPPIEESRRPAAPPPAMAHHAQPPAVRHAPPAPVAVAASGRWRIQLGAFRDEGNARSLWSSVAGRLPGARPTYASAGGVTRLQAGPFAGRAEAQRACAAVRHTCVVVAP
jgi:hypothetical protein